MRGGRTRGPDAGRKIAMSRRLPFPEDRPDPLSEEGPARPARSGPRGRKDPRQTDLEDAIAAAEHETPRTHPA